MWQVGYSPAETYHDTVTHRSNHYVAMQQTDWTAMPERSSGTQEKTSSDNTTNTDGGSDEQTAIARKGRCSFLPDHGNMPILELTLEPCLGRDIAIVDVGFRVKDISTGDVPLLVRELLVVAAVGHGVAGMGRMRA